MSISDNYNFEAQQINCITAFNSAVHDNGGGINAVLDTQPNNVAPAPAEDCTIGMRI